ncbi:hypothetical protein J2W22_003624 [Sphingomonas kyeonggiensis]|uniref:hypothetical protein n=1 Tax=Sphingomonas kyeonggiensis TaxID=1268553 RepID=UPI00277F86E5|nr:hypothetical protein [Sphingomonas kyeonggiensis]MDQ0251536.1 hypothetical protein [Sphingomonas kyeonggiensis]
MKFRMEYDAARNRILVEIRDFWTVETVQAFAAAAGAKAQEVRAIRSDYDVLIDSRALPVQANDVADLLPSIAEAGLTLTSGRAASVVGSALNKLQAERTQTHPRMRIFMTMEEAEGWLGEAR